MDSVTTQYLARELHARWSGRRVAACVFDRKRAGVVLGTAGSPAVRIDLAAPEPRACADATAASGGLLSGWIVDAVDAPVDDRRLLIRVAKPGKFRGSASRGATIEISLVPSARGAHLRDDVGRTLASLGAAPPPATAARPELTDDELREAAARRDADSLMRGRWVSQALARWLLSEPSSIVARYREICALPPARPSRCAGRLIPHPWCADPIAANSLIEPSCGSEHTMAPDGTSTRERALERMRRELARAASAPRLRRVADALMALGDDGATPSDVALPDGSVATVDARPGESPVDVAERLYRDVRSMERALERLPARIAALERAGEAPGKPQQLPVARRERPSREEPARPFRTYRSSGGLDIWVGRGAASNDRLTFEFAAPDDVWLHARDASGAHVVLRWQRDEPPPARDLAEAAALAAWHSRARGATVVPVDWTRRKYVRKPRGARAGLVVLSRADTVFARPSAEAERRLRAGRERA